MQILTYRVKPVLLFALLFITFKTQAQYKCAFDQTAKAVAEKYPLVQQRLNELKQPSVYRSAAKATITEPYTIPLIFHFVLNQQQFNRIGGDAGIKKRIDSQLIVINRDFNAQNADSAAIPSNFKKLYGNVAIRFALAHTDPYGRSTEGYDVKIISQNGFEAEGGTGSGFGFSDAKYAGTGGVDAWDVETYLNVWVIAPLDGGVASNILGLAIPEYFANSYSMPAVEQGVILNYGAVGKREALLEYYINGSDEGRTLTHEIGHYFELLHIWGDDDGKCPDNGGTDDGITDTPPQAYPSEGCFVYPKFDGCSRTGDGIMFMNYMDYSNDKCALLFTKEQVLRMQRTWQIGGNLFSLTQHPWVLEYPANAATDNSYVLYPNPADGYINISFRKSTTDMQQIMLVDLMGRVVLSKPIEYQAAFYTVNTGTLQAGLYLLVLHYNGGKQAERVLVR